MLTATFDRLFSRLVTTFKRYQDAPRTPDSVAVLAFARRDLDLARSAVATERHAIFASQSARRAPRRTAVSEDDIARLRVFGTGFVGS